MTTVAELASAAIQGLQDAYNTKVKTLITPVGNVKGYGAVGDGIADDTTAIKNAVADACNNGSWVYWPDGTYLTTANIPNFHDVKHFGPGVVKRDTDIFTVQPKEGNTNNIYVDPNGDDNNDGLSASEPLQTIQAALDVLYNYGPVLNGTYVVNLAGGTYTEGAEIGSLKSVNRITIQGPDVSLGTPTAVVDGTNSANVHGLNFNGGMYGEVSNVKVINFTNSDNSCGVIFNNGSNGKCYNVHVDNCSIGVGFSQWGRGRLNYGKIENCTYHGVRIYSGIIFSIGDANDADNKTIINNCGANGLLIRDGSYGRIDYVAIDGCDYGARLQNNARLHLANSSVENCTSIAIYLQYGSTVNDDNNTYLGNGNKIVADSFSTILDDEIYTYRPDLNRVEMHTLQWTENWLRPITDEQMELGTVNNKWKRAYLNELKLTPLDTEPSLANGKIVYADGTNWDPGNGEGFYMYEAGAWKKM